MSHLQKFIKFSAHKYEIYPLFVIMGGALSGLVYMSVHQSQSPDVVWNHKTNSQPWQQVKEGDQVKLAAYNQKYERKFKRAEW